MYASVVCVRELKVTVKVFRSSERRKDGNNESYKLSICTVKEAEKG